MDDSNDATGVLVFEVTGGVEVNNNDAYSNDLGVGVGTASGVRISNLTHDNTFDGLRAESDTMQILFAENRSQSNGVTDCHDDSHGTGTADTANTWKNDFGVTQTPPGICRPNGDWKALRGFSRRGGDPLDPSAGVEQVAGAMDVRHTLELD